MDKTVGYYLEQFTGAILGFITVLLVNSWWDIFSFVSEKDFFDKLIPVCTTLFGFLLTILTLIIQSNSQIVLEMKKRSKYGSLIRFNKKIVLFSILITVLCLIMVFLTKVLVCEYPTILKIISLFNLFLFIWTIVDTIVFVTIFYEILLTDSKK